MSLIAASDVCLLIKSIENSFIPSPVICSKSSSDTAVLDSAIISPLASSIISSAKYVSIKSFGSTSYFVRPDLITFLKAPFVIDTFVLTMY